MKPTFLNIKNRKMKQGKMKTYAIENTHCDKLTIEATNFWPNTKS